MDTRERIIIISGDHGAGKSTTAEEMTSTHSCVRLIKQYTSRKPRGDGQETENHFVTLEEVEQCDIVGEYIDGDGTKFKLGYKLSEIYEAIKQGQSPILIGHKAITDQLREKLPENLSLEIFLEGDKKVAAQKIVADGKSTREKAESRLARGWKPERPVVGRHTSYVIRNTYGCETRSTIQVIIQEHACHSNPSCRINQDQSKGGVQK